MPGLEIKNKSFLNSIREMLGWHRCWAQILIGIVSQRMYVNRIAQFGSGPGQFRFGTDSKGFGVGLR